MKNDALATRGLQIAERTLMGRGYEILDRSWICREGTIDMVALDGESLVFIEIVTRSSTRYGHPFEAITPSKLARLRRIAAEWLAAKGPIRTARSLRIDAISVIASPNAAPTVEHLEGIF